MTEALVRHTLVVSVLPIKKGRTLILRNVCVHYRHITGIMRGTTRLWQAVHKIKHLRDQEQQERFREMAQDASHRDGHACTKHSVF
jgi:hypothetical protein